MKVEKKYIFACCLAMLSVSEDTARQIKEKMIKDELESIWKKMIFVQSCYNPESLVID
jgi:hypothetical protein